MAKKALELPLDALRDTFGDRLQENVRMCNYTTSNIGGKVDALVMAHSNADLAQAVQTLWKLNIPYRILGYGSNVLISDRGVREVVIINQARTMKVDMHTDPPTLWAETGASLSGAARQALLRRLSGLEWSACIPGTIGGAVYGNAGAYGFDMGQSITLVDILHPETGRTVWTNEQMQYQYRSSILKRQPDQHIVILAARMALKPDSQAAIQARMDEFKERRTRSQPVGNSLGSIFKNPPDEHAGRLIEAVGLKGTRIGGAEISQTHANIFVNKGGATADDVWQLIEKARQAVLDRFGVQLELEVEQIGEW